VKRLEKGAVGPEKEYDKVVDKKMVIVKEISMIKKKSSTLHKERCLEGISGIDPIPLQDQGCKAFNSLERLCFKKRIPRHRWLTLSHSEHTA
jgi:hypothetical protein